MGGRIHILLKVLPRLLYPCSVNNCTGLDSFLLKSGQIWLEILLRSQRKKSSTLHAHLRTQSLVFCRVDANTTQLITDQVHQLHNHSPPSLQLSSQNSTHEGKALSAQIAASLMCFCFVTASPSSNSLSSHNFIGCCSLETTWTPDDWWTLATIKGVLLQIYELLFSSVP